MTTNPYFRKHVPSEQRLIDSLTIEAIKIHGYDYIYIPRELVSQDTLLGDVVSKFTDINRIEMYFNSPDAGFAPSPPATGHLISRFGLEIPDEGTFIVSQRRFLEVMSHNQNIRELGSPREGDLIYFDYAKAFFEIKFVEKEMPFYPLGLKSIFQLSCQRFIYNQEEIITGQTDIDQGALFSSDYAQIFGLTAGITGSAYTVGERVFVGSSIEPSAQGSVIAKTTSPKTITVNVRMATGTFSVGNVVTGDSSGTQFVIDSITDSTIKVSNVAQQDNDEIDLETNRDQIFDFTDTDPFSEGAYK